jgi:hypothetical protein
VDFDQNYYKGMLFEFLEITKNEDGTTNIEVEFDEGFRNWFMKEQGLKRWSNKRFEKFLLEELKEYISVSED